MIKKMKYASFIIPVVCALIGCETIERARIAQDEVSGATNDVFVASANRSSARVNLQGSDLYDFAAFAMTNRPSLETARLNVSNSVLALQRVTSDRALQMSLSGGYSQATANGGSHFSWHQPRGKGSADLSFDLLLCDFGRIDARELEARENLAAAKRALADEEFAVFNEVAQSYFTLLCNDALFEVAKTNTFMFAEHLRQSESLFDAGEAKKLDVLKARVDLSVARREQVNASNEVLKASAGFMRALGLSNDVSSREELLAVRDDALEVDRVTLAATTYDPVYALDVARTNAPSLMILRAKLRAANARVDYAIADLLPELSLSSAFSFADPTLNWSWGVRAVQSVLDGFRKQTAVDSAVVDLHGARVALDDAEQKLSYDLSVATTVRDNARQSFKMVTIQVQQARENYENVLAQYRVGDASRLDFTDAANTLVNALGARVKAFYAGEIAEAELIRLTGRITQSEKEHSEE